MHYETSETIQLFSYTSLGQAPQTCSQRGFDAAPKHLVRSRKHRNIGKKSIIFFNFFTIFKRFVLIFFKSFQK
jgi:hypothetical protein